VGLKKNALGIHEPKTLYENQHFSPSYFPVLKQYLRACTSAQNILNSKAQRLVIIFLNKKSKEKE
jgi:hypothetical protein